MQKLRQGSSKLFFLGVKNKKNHLGLIIRENGHERAKGL